MANRQAQSLEASLQILPNLHRKLPDIVVSTCVFHSFVHIKCYKGYKRDFYCDVVSHEYSKPIYDPFMIFLSV